MTQHEIVTGLFVGDDQYDRENSSYNIIDLREWDAEWTFEEEEFFLIDAMLRLIKITLETSTENPVLVHCHAGMDRSPFIAAMYLHVYEGIPVDTAYAWVKRKRPQTIEHWEWVTPYVKWLKKEKQHTLTRNVEDIIALDQFCTGCDKGDCSEPLKECETLKAIDERIRKMRGEEK